MKKLWILGLMFLVGCCRCHRTQDILQPKQSKYSLVGTVMDMAKAGDSCVQITFSKDDGYDTVFAFKAWPPIWKGEHVQINYSEDGWCGYAVDSTKQLK